MDVVCGFEGKTFGKTFGFKGKTVLNEWLVARTKILFYIVFSL